jgi:hypothetical protein
MSDEQKLQQRSDRLAVDERKTYRRLCQLRTELDVISHLLDRSTMHRPTLMMGTNLVPFRRKGKP